MRNKIILPAHDNSGNTYPSVCSFIPHRKLKACFVTLDTVYPAKTSVNRFMTVHCSGRFPLVSLHKPCALIFVNTEEEEAVLTALQIGLDGGDFVSQPSWIISRLVFDISNEIYANNREICKKCVTHPITHYTALNICVAIASSWLNDWMSSCKKKAVCITFSITDIVFHSVARRWLQLLEFKLYNNTY